MRRRDMLAILAAVVLVDPVFAKQQRLEVDDYTTKIQIDGNRFRYEWEHEGRTVSIVFLPETGFISSDARRHIDTLPDSHDRSLMIKMAEEDPYRRQFIRPLVEAVASKARSIGIDPVRLLLSLTQGMSYKRENRIQAWPTEVLLNAHGDCSDTSVLFAALLEQFQATRVRTIGGTPLWAFLFSPREKRHMAVGVRSYAGIRYSGVSWVKNNEHYFVSETTGTGWDIGKQPPSLQTAHIILPRSWTI